MSEPKTKKTRASVNKFLSSISSESQRQDCIELVSIMQELTGEKPSMWGEKIVGFGTYHYRYATGREGDWPAAGFSPGKQSISVYIMPGFSKYNTLMEKLGRYKTGKSCLYIKKLEDVRLPVLKRLIKRGYDDIKKMYPSW